MQECSGCPWKKKEFSPGNPLESFSVTSWPKCSLKCATHPNCTDWTWYKTNHICKIHSAYDSSFTLTKSNSRYGSKIGKFYVSP